MVTNLSSVSGLYPGPTNPAPPPSSYFSSLAALFGSRNRTNCVEVEGSPARLWIAERNFVERRAFHPRNRSGKYDLGLVQNFLLSSLPSSILLVISMALICVTSISVARTPRAPLLIASVPRCRQALPYLSAPLVPSLFCIQHC